MSSKALGHDPTDDMQVPVVGKGDRLSSGASTALVRHTVDPNELGPARAALARVVAAIDAKAFDPVGEHKTRTSGQTFAEYIDDWWIDYVEKHELSARSLKPVCGVLKRSPLGHTALHDLTTDQIECWLSTELKTRNWRRKTYNAYHGLIQRLLDRAVRRRRLKFNPARAIERMKGVSAHRGEFRHFRVDEEVEKRLLDALV